MAKRQPRKGAIPAKRGKKPAGGSRADAVATRLFQWRVDQLDWGGDWSWGKVEASDLLKEVIPKLHSFESMTWAAVEGATGSHSVSIERCCTAAQKRSNDKNLECDTLFSLRIKGEMRVWGVRDVAILRLLWWDPHHSVYPSLR